MITESSDKKLVTELETDLGHAIPLPTELQIFATQSERNQKLLVLAYELVQNCYAADDTESEVDKGKSDYLISICRVIERSYPGIKRHLIDFLVNQPNLSLKQNQLQKDLLYAWIQQAEDEVAILRNPENRKKDEGLVAKISLGISDLLDKVTGFSRFTRCG